MKRIYLACPYTSRDRREEFERRLQATKKAGVLMLQGHLVFSPITHGHEICMQNDEIGKCAATWAKFNDSILETWATHVYVLMLDGWRESKGVAYEIELAKELGLTVEYVEL